LPVIVGQYYKPDCHTGTVIGSIIALALGGCLAMFGSQAAYYSELFTAEFRFTGLCPGPRDPRRCAGRACRRREEAADERLTAIAAKVYLSAVITL